MRSIGKYNFLNQLCFSDGTSFRVTANGLEKQPGIFISRLVPGGLAEGTGLLAVNDEVLEVNGIEVAGKSLDQVKFSIFQIKKKTLSDLLLFLLCLKVTDMMVANSAKLIITVKPANQRTLAAPRRGSFSRNSQVSSGSQQSQHTNPASDEIDNDDQEDEVIDLIEHQSLDDSNSLINQKDGVLHL